MSRKCNTFWRSGAVVLLIAAMGCHAVPQSATTLRPGGRADDVSTTTMKSNQIQCYVCDNCLTITADTPKATCDRSYFQSTTSAPSTTTTTEMTTEEFTTMPITITEESSSSSTSTSTTQSTTTTTTTTTTTEPTTITTTEEDEGDTTEMDTTTPEESSSSAQTSTTTKMPTPPTVAPVSTTVQPTPPNPGTAIVPAVVLGQDSNKPILNSTRLLERQVRQVANPPYTYHCYTIKKQEANNTIVTERGCARVRTQQAVCSTLEADNTNPDSNKTDVTNCFACSMPLCNEGHVAVRVPIIMMLFSVLVVAVNQGMQRH